MKKIIVLLLLVCMSLESFNKRDEETLINQIALLSTKSSVLMAGASTAVYAAVKCIPCFRKSYSITIAKGIPYSLAMLTFGVSNYLINYKTCDLAFEKGQFYKNLK